MTLIGALGGIEPDELRATFNGGLGMVMVVPADAAEATVRAAAAREIPAWVVGEVVGAPALGGARYAEGPLEGGRR
jgi:phosphoribosylformylglycinamidine cyclo-ligase